MSRALRLSSPDWDEASYARVLADIKSMRAEDRCGQPAWPDRVNRLDYPYEHRTLNGRQGEGDIMNHAPKVEEVTSSASSANSARPRTRDLADFRFEMNGQIMDFDGMLASLFNTVRLARDQALLRSSTGFKFEPLNQASNSIRLLDLKPGKFHDPFMINMRTVCLEKPPAYEALSYTWGKATATAALSMEGRGSMAITHNLDEALRHIRSEKVEKTLWVDAICIDQSDNAERTDQVRKMLDIYRSADQVLVWLGPKAQDSDLAIDLIQRIPTLDFSRLRSGMTEADHREWGALRDLLRRPWWRRVWIVQESSIPTKEPLVGCGSSWLAWSVYEKAYTCIVDQLTHIDFRLPRAIIHLNVQRVFAMRRRVMRKGTDINIAAVLFDVQWFEASDPRDKVFAVHGLIADCFKRYITIDYDKSVTEVYTSLAEFMVNFDLNQLLIRTASTMPGLPSWVSDWSSSEIRFGADTGFFKPDVYNAGGPRLSPPLFSTPVGQAFFHGAFLDKVLAKDDTPPMEENLNSEDILRTVNSFERTLLHAHQMYPDIQLLQAQHPLRNDAFVRCLVTDTELNGTVTGFIAGPPRTPMPRAPRDFWDLMQVLQGRANVPAAYCPQLPAQERRDKYTIRLQRALKYALPNSSFFITSWGFLGLARHDVQVGDRIAIIFGVQMPVVLRPVDAPATAYKLIGPAYIHLMMDGTALSLEHVEAAKNRQDDGKYNICLV